MFINPQHYITFCNSWQSFLPLFEFLNMLLFTKMVYFQGSEVPNDIFSFCFNICSKVSIQLCHLEGLFDFLPFPKSMDTFLLVYKVSKCPGLQYIPFDLGFACSFSTIWSKSLPPPTPESFRNLSFTATHTPFADSNRSSSSNA